MQQNNIDDNQRDEFIDKMTFIYNAFDEGELRHILTTDFGLTEDEAEDVIKECGLKGNVCIATKVIQILLGRLKLKDNINYERILQQKSADSEEAFRKAIEEILEQIQLESLKKIIEYLEELSLDNSPTFTP